MNFKFKNKSGITLIALIITIIVMLILVAVSISVALNTGLFKSAGDATKNWKSAQDAEANVGSEIKIGDKTYSSIEEYIEDTKPLPEGAGKKFTETKEYTDGTKTAVIPGGFTVSGAGTEKTIDGGLVIYLINDKTEEDIVKIDWNDEATLKHLKETYDQFVWVPVTDANKMFMCQAKTESDSGCDLKIEGNEVICQTHKTADATKSKKMAGRLYATSLGGNFNSSLTTQTYNANSGLREPAKLTDTDSSYVNQEEEPNLDLQTEYNNAVKKVIESKGFWIGRYETSGMDSSNDDIAVIAGKGANDGINNITWYRMYKQQQNYASKKSLDTSTIQSTMIFGAAYDQAMLFANCAKATTPRKAFSAVITGNVETDCYKNIYDLCGNLVEWTTEADYTDHRVYRGRHLRPQ